MLLVSKIKIKSHLHCMHLFFLKKCLRIERLFWGPNTSFHEEIYIYMHNQQTRNVATTLMQRHDVASDVASKLIQCCIKLMCPLGIDLSTVTLYEKSLLKIFLLILSSSF